MESYIPISFLNDFIFCPRSIYFHQLYGKVERRLYQDTPQVLGEIAHDRVDRKEYSTRKHVFQAIEIYSEVYNLGGKIDTFDIKEKLLVERKKKISVIYDGFIYQLFAQYHCLTEMGYTVETLKLYSIEDNKSYIVESPEKDIIKQKEFELLLQNIRSFDLNLPFEANINKCRNCIYRELCDKSLC